MKLIGFAVWETRDRGRRNVTFPARQYSLNGERRVWSSCGRWRTPRRLRNVILAAYAEWEAAQTVSA
jgi:hypothetical protein